MGLQMRFCTILLVIFALGSGVVHARKSPEGAPQDVTYCQLAKDPAAFSGKRIRIRAIYRYMFEIERLEPPACCPESIGKFKIWAQIDLEPEAHSEKLFRKFPKGL